MLLHDYLDRYNSTRDLRSSTADHYHWVVQSFRHLHGDLDLTALTADHLTAWLRWLADNGRSPWTIKQRRISLLVLWRSAWLDGLAPPIPPLRRARPLHYAVQAWTPQEVLQLVAAAERLDGRFCRTGLRRDLWLASLVRTGYDTGLRLGDLLRFPACEMGELPVLVQQSKTRWPTHVRVRPETLCAVRACLADGPPRRLLWPLWGRREAFYRLLRRTVAAAGIRPGTFRWLRRAAATACERDSPGSGTLLLGHQHRSTTEAWYIDRSQLGSPPLPPL